MRKIVLMMSISLDGYSEGPDRDISRHRADDELHAHMNETVTSMGGLLHARAASRAHGRLPAHRRRGPRGSRVRHRVRAGLA